MGRRGRNNLDNTSLFFVTTTVVNFSKIFVDGDCCKALLNNILHYKKKYNYEILGYVIMPSHFHWIIKIDTGNGTISDIMRDIKKYSAWEILDVLQKKKNEELLNVFKESVTSYRPQKRKLWMARFDDEAIRDQKMFFTKLKYIHNNPVKAGLVERAEDYIYSSARNYINDDHSILSVNTDLGGVEMK